MVLAICTTRLNMLIFSKEYNCFVKCDLTLEFDGDYKRPDNYFFPDMVFNYYGGLPSSGTFFVSLPLPTWLSAGNGDPYSLAGIQERLFSSLSDAIEYYSVQAIHYALNYDVPNSPFSSPYIERVFYFGVMYNFRWWNNNGVSPDFDQKNYHFKLTFSPIPICNLDYSPIVRLLGGIPA